MTKTSKITTSRKLLGLLAGLGIASAAFSASPEASAQAAQICTFQQDASLMNYSDGYHRDELTFSWNNTTGAVTTAQWKYVFGGVTYTYTPFPSGGYGTVDPGFSPSGSSSESAFTLRLQDPASSPNPVILKGRIARTGLVSGDATLAAIQTGSYSAWIGGYGTVSCQ